MHVFTLANKRRIVREIIIGARLYQKYLVDYDFLIITDDGQCNMVKFYKYDFGHLTGVRTFLNDLDFYNLCVNGSLTVNNIKDYQHYDFGTVRKKIIRIKKINRIIYANAPKNLVLINLHTNTFDFPLAIESVEDKMIVAFVGDDLHARSLRSNSKKRMDEKKKIIAIFSKTSKEDMYTKCVYLKNYQLLKERCLNLETKVAVRILDELDKYHKN